VGFAQQRGTNHGGFMFSRHGNSPKEGKKADGRYHTTPKSAPREEQMRSKKSSTKPGAIVAGCAREAAPAKQPERSQSCEPTAKPREREPGRTPAKRREPGEAAASGERAKPREAASARRSRREWRAGEAPRSGVSPAKPAREARGRSPAKRPEFSELRARA
jgi:hypothetical protein